MRRLLSLHRNAFNACDAAAGRRFCVLLPFWRARVSRKGALMLRYCFCWCDSASLVSSRLRLCSSARLLGFAMVGCAGFLFCVGSPPLLCVCALSLPWLLSAHPVASVAARLVPSAELVGLLAVAGAVLLWCSWFWRALSFLCGWSGASASLLVCLGVSVSWRVGGGGDQLGRLAGACPCAVLAFVPPASAVCFACRCSCLFVFLTAFGLFLCCFSRVFLSVYPDPPPSGILVTTSIQP